MNRLSLTVMKNRHGRYGGYSLKREDMIAGYAGKLLRERFGKGPESIYVSADDRSVSMHIRNFLGPVEHFLLSQSEEQSFRQIRELLMKSLLPELKHYLLNEAGFEAREVYYDWGIHNASGMIVALAPDNRGAGECYPGREEAEAQMIAVSERIQKAPDRIYSWWPNRRTLLIVREGILIAIERELIGLGYEQILKSTKRKLEKRHLEHETAFDRLFGRKLADFYVDWDFELDKSVTVYSFQP